MKTNCGKKLSISKERFWQQHIRNCKSSGLSQNRYCQQHGLAFSTFTYWKKKLNSKKKQRAHFYPLTVPVQQSSVSVSKSDAVSSITKTGIFLRNSQSHFYIEVTEDFSVTCLRKVLSALERS